MRRNGRMYGTGRAVYCRCTRCGRGGARCYYIMGLVHKTCLTISEKKDYEAKLKQSYTKLREGK